jgi:hypothetical protein
MRDEKSNKINGRAWEWKKFGDFDLELPILQHLLREE